MCTLGERKATKHKHCGGIVPRLDGCQKVVCVCFLPVSLWEEKRANTIARKFRGNPGKFMFMCLLFGVFLALGQLALALQGRQ